MTPEEALALATRGGAQVLGRADDLGSLEPGKCADVAIFPAADLFSSGAENPVDGLVLCFPRQVETLIVNGVVRVREGRIPGLDLAELLAQHGRIARRITGGL
jgi:8-oxoguanine deaminase